MDYIQEELRRQREALAALLLGGASRQSGEGGEDRAASSPRVSAPGPEAVTVGAVPALAGARPHHPVTAPGAFTADLKGLTAPGIAGGARPRTAGPGGTAEDSPRDTGPVSPAGVGPREGTLIFPEETAPPPSAGGGTAVEIPGSPAARQGAGEAPWMRTVMEYVYPIGGVSAGEAESLSRAFQRDARRYDGGFSLY